MAAIVWTETDESLNGNGHGVEFSHSALPGTVVAFVDGFQWLHEPPTPALVKVLRVVPPQISAAQWKVILFALLDVRPQPRGHPVEAFQSSARSSVSATAVSAGVRVSERRSRLLGLDAPVVTKSELTGSLGVYAEPLAAERELFSQLDVQHPRGTMA